MLHVSCTRIIKLTRTRPSFSSCKTSTNSSATQLANNSNDMLSPLRTITDDLKELFDLDPNAWGDLTSFETDTSLDLSGKSPATTNRWFSPGMTGKSTQVLVLFKLYRKLRKIPDGNLTRNFLITTKGITTKARLPLQTYACAKRIS